MRKVFLMIAVCLATSVVYAKGAATNANEEQPTGIITPNIATTGYRTSRIAYSAFGDLLVCPEVDAQGNEVKYVEKDATCQNYKSTNTQWVHPQYHPRFKTKQYVGFRIVTQSYYTFYEFYYK